MSMSTVKHFKYNTPITPAQITAKIDSLNIATGTFTGHVELAEAVNTLTPATVKTILAQKGDE